MKRFYIAPREVWLAHVDMFDVEGTSHVELEDGHVLINTDFKSSWAEGVWHEHPEVARLAHPHYESQVPLAHLHQHAQHGHKKFQKHHFDKLNGLLAVSELQPIDDTHTLWDLHARLIGKYPGLTLNRY
jgi:hypothetical protein